jgi:hypothetical protein
MERMHYVAHAEALSTEQRQLYFLGPNDDAAQFLITKLAPHRATGPVAALQAKVIALAANVLTLTAEIAASISAAHQLASPRADGHSGCSGRARSARCPRPVRAPTLAARLSLYPASKRWRACTSFWLYRILMMILNRLWRTLNQLRRQHPRVGGCKCRDGRGRAGWTRRWPSGLGTELSSRRWTASCRM